MDDDLRNGLEASLTVVMAAYQAFGLERAALGARALIARSTAAEVRENWYLRYLDSGGI